MKQKDKKSKHIFKMLWGCHNYIPEKKIYKDYKMDIDGFWQIMTDQYTIFKCIKCGKTKKRVTKTFPKF